MLGSAFVFMWATSVSIAIVVCCAYKVAAMNATPTRAKDTTIQRRCALADLTFIRIPNRTAWSPDCSSMSRLMLEILLIDDDEMVRVEVASALQDAGHRVTCAADGEQALALARARPFD